MKMKRAMEKSISDITFYPLLKPKANPAANPPVSGIPEFEMASKIWSLKPGKNGVLRLKPLKLVMAFPNAASTFAQFRATSPLYCK